MSKKQQRITMLKQLNTLSQKQYEEWSHATHERFLELPAVKEADVIGITLSRFPEVATHALIERLWELGKTVVVPRCIVATKEMDFRKITSFTNLETVYYNLAEPIIEETVAISKNNIDVLVVPGVIYSKSGYRIGFGGGYYDRFLTDYKGATVSLAFSLQLVEEVPIETHDVPVMKIVTECSIIDC